MEEKVDLPYEPQSIPVCEELEIRWEELQTQRGGMGLYMPQERGGGAVVTDSCQSYGYRRGTCRRRTFVETLFYMMSYKESS